jgi:hypothetical protein
MFRRSMRWGIVIVALLAPLAGACSHAADDCHNLGTCPLPDAGDAGTDAADGSD